MKKSFKYLVRMLSICLIVLVFSNCNDMEALAAANPYISIKSNPSIMDKGSSKVFTVKSVGLKKTKIVWSSSNSKILKVDKTTGKVTAVNPGKAVITAKDSLSNKQSVLTVSVYYTKNQMASLGYQVEKKKYDNGTFGYTLKKITTTSKNLVLPYGVTEINCNIKRLAIDSIKFPDTITSEYEIYLEGSNVKKVKLPSDLKVIYDEMFVDCNKMTEIILPKKLVTISDYAFDNCASLTEITLPKTLKTIGDGAFENCDNLQKIVIPDSVTSIGEDAFMECFSLKSVKLSSELKTLGAQAFYNCSKLSEITMPDKLKKIGEGAFKGCNRIREITIPKTVTHIGDEVFHYTTDLRTLTFRGDPNAIQWGNNLFYESGLGVAALYNSGYHAMFSKYEKERIELINSALKEMNISEQDTELEKIRKVHDWMVTNISYNLNHYFEEVYNDRDSVEVVLKDRFAVCDGYARTFQAFMTELGMECRRVTSEGMNHAWNIILLDDGHWYHVDVTWDDPGSNDYEWFAGSLGYKYLILNDDQIRGDHSGWDEDEDEEVPKCDGTKYMNYFDHSYYISLGA